MVFSMKFYFCYETLLFQTTQLLKILCVRPRFKLTIFVTQQ